MTAARIVSAVMGAALLVWTSGASCDRKGKMPDCMERWRSLLASKQPKDELRRAEEFAACTREEHLSFELTLSDRASGKTVAVAELGKVKAPVTVRVKLGKGGEVLVWEPIANESVMGLLGE